MKSTKLSTLLGIEYPIIQGGMVWCSGWKLASAVSNCGGLGVIGSGSMNPELLREHIVKCKKATDKPFAVNIPLIYQHAYDYIPLLLELEVPVVITSAGSPKKFTAQLKEKGVKVGHVVPSAKLAKKCQDAGVDFVVCEGFEAGGHNGLEETTSFCLIPQVARSVSIPFAAAGGIATGAQILASQVLGAQGVQIGTRFACSEESSAHENFKNHIAESCEGNTMLTLKKIVPVRLAKNDFFTQIKSLEEKTQDSYENLSELLGRGRARKGIFEGDLKEGELEYGQISSLVDEVLPVKVIMKQLLEEYEQARIECQQI